MERGHHLETQVRYEPARIALKNVVDFHRWARRAGFPTRGSGKFVFLEDFHRRTPSIATQEPQLRKLFNFEEQVSKYDLMRSVRCPLTRLARSVH